MEPYLLQDEELKELVVKIPGWEINNEQIQRGFKFSNFIDRKLYLFLKLMFDPDLLCPPNHEYLT